MEVRGYMLIRLARFKLNTFPGYGLNFGLFFLTNQKDIIIIIAIYFGRL
jgi:hypothetical protein